VSDPLTVADAMRRSGFSLYQKTARTLISDITFPPGTVYDTPEGLRAEDEETRAALDARGGIYPIREAIFRATYVLDAAPPAAYAPVPVGTLQHIIDRCDDAVPERWRIDAIRALALRALEPVDATPPAAEQVCARYYGSDGSVCATHTGHFIAATDARCDRAESY
jgi:hypothetical protein